MPPRTNDFQRLIKRIYAQLSGPGVEITESAMLADTRDGTKREVDVLVVHTSHGHRFVAAIECRAHQRPATVEWIDLLQGKYAGLYVDKVIAVSNSGFRPAAIKRAAALKIVRWPYQTQS
jgi:hypothetical protein